MRIFRHALAGPKMILFLTMNRLQHSHPREADKAGLPRPRSGSASRSAKPCVLAGLWGAWRRTGRPLATCGPSCRSAVSRLIKGRIPGHTKPTHSTLLDGGFKRGRQDLFRVFCFWKLRPLEVVTDVWTKRRFRHAAIFSVSETMLNLGRWATQLRR